MRKEKFIQALRNHLSELPEAEVEKSVNYFNEMIADRMEEGMSEEEAVADVGDVRLIAEKILAEEKPLLEQLRAQIIPQKKLSGWQKVLLALGSPLWLALLLAAGCLFLAACILYGAFWLVAGTVTLAGITTLVAAPFKLLDGLDITLLTAAVGFTALGLGLIFLHAAYRSYEALLPAFRRLRGK